MAITFYAASNSSAVPVACALHELGVPHERINVRASGRVSRRPRV
jgi:hypothetical protein